MTSAAVSYSRFPAAVLSDKRRERKAAVIVSAGVARVAVLVPGQGVQVVEEFAVASIAPQPNRETQLVAEDGTVWTVGRGDGCGCGSPLRTWYNKSLGAPKRREK